MSNLLPKQKRIIEQFGENLRLARLRRKLTCEQVAERAGISRNTLYLLERGKGNTSLNTLIDVLNVYGLLDGLAKVASYDPLGQKLRDIELLTNGCDPISAYADQIWRDIGRGLRRLDFDERIGQIVGMTAKDLISYLNDNLYGLEYGQPGLDIDHIKPISSAYSLNSVEALSHYSNLQLLPAKYNRVIKRASKWDQQGFINWLDSQNDCVI